MVLTLGESLALLFLRFFYKNLPHLREFKDKEIANIFIRILFYISLWYITCYNVLYLYCFSILKLNAELVSSLSKNKTVFMKKNTIYILISILFIWPSQIKAQNNEMSDAEHIAELMVPTLAKTILLLSQKSAEDQIIIVCKGYSVTITYGEILDLGVPTYENLKELFIIKILPQISKEGEVLVTLFDKYLMRDVNQNIDLKETALDFGLQLIVDSDEVQTYLQPETSRDYSSNGNTEPMAISLDNSGVNSRNLNTLYGTIIENDYQNYKSEILSENSRAIKDLTNLFTDWDQKQIETYYQYLELTLQAVEIYLENKKITN